MARNPAFDVAEAHRFFSAECFNAAWALIRKNDRTPEENERMLALSAASLWHWTERKDCTRTNLSIAYWQLARIQAILGRGAEARRAGELCLKHSQGEGPFFLGYAHEALARAEKAAGNADGAAVHRAEAARLAATIADEEDRKALLDDLETL